MFKKCGTYKPEIGDHWIIYEERMEKVRKLKTKTITFRQTKNTDFEELNRDLNDTPWHMGDIFSNSSEIIIWINCGQTRTHEKENSEREGSSIYNG